MLSCFGDQMLVDVVLCLPSSPLLSPLQTPRVPEASLHRLEVERSVLQRELNILCFQKEVLMQKKVSSRKYKALPFKSQGTNSKKSKGNAF